MKAVAAVDMAGGTLRQMKHTLHQLADRVGVEAVPYSSTHHFVGRRDRLFRSLGIDLVFDVGANRGQYAEELRRFGYRGWIVSFEPLAGPYAVLRKRAAKDQLWQTVNLALGRDPARAIMNVAANSASSSLLDMLPLHRQAAPYALYVGVEPVEVVRLDDVATRYVDGKRGVFLKIDAQGYEPEILSGGREILARVAGIEIELSFAHLYTKDMLIHETMDQLQALGFRLCDLRPGFADSRSGRLLQADGIFVRPSEEE